MMPDGEEKTKRYLNSRNGQPGDMFVCYNCRAEYAVIAEMTKSCPKCGTTICTIPGCECGGCA